VAATRLRANFGFFGSRIAQATGTNAKLSEYAAALGLAGLDEWPARAAAFQAAAMRYRDNLANLPLRMPEGWGEEWQSTTCVVRLQEPAHLETVLASLHAAGAETRAWWGRGMHTHPAFGAYPKAALPMTKRLAETTLGLPFFIDMTTEEIDIVCHALREGLARCC
jgi:dTDP-4-amino-4,6-dideoxygalactose transaminase